MGTMRPFVVETGKGSETSVMDTDLRLLFFLDTLNEEIRRSERDLIRKPVVECGEDSERRFLVN